MTERLARHGQPAGATPLNGQEKPPTRYPLPATRMRAAVRTPVGGRVRLSRRNAIPKFVSRKKKQGPQASAFHFSGTPQ
jgi:hypothetical protein